MSLFTTSRRALLGLIAALPVFRSAAAVAPDTFTLVPGGIDGQSWRFRLEQKIVRNGAVGLHATTDVTLSVLARTDGGWLVRWTPVGGQLLATDPRVRPMMEAIRALWDGVPVDIALDAGGRVAGLADPGAVRALAGATLERLAGTLEADPAQAPVAAQVRAAMGPLLLDSPLLAQSLLKEPMILLGAMGHAFRVGEPLEVRANIPSPLGAGEFPVLGRYAVRGIDRRSGHADIGWLMVIDRANAARLLAPQLRDTLARGGMAVTDELLAETLAALDFDDRGDYLVDTATAWPVRVRHERRVSAQGASRVDQVTLTRLQD